MKLYYVTTVLLVLSSSAVAGKLDIIKNIDLDQLGVLVLLNKGQPSTDGSFCSSEDERLLQVSLNQVLPFTRRNLRAGGDEKQDGRMLINCRAQCQGYARGSCYVVHPSCKGYRRELMVSDEKVEESNTNENTSRVVQRSLLLELKAIEKMCSRVMEGVEDQLVAILHAVEGGLSSPCLKLIQKKVTMECKLMSDDE